MSEHSPCFPQSGGIAHFSSLLKFEITELQIWHSHDDTRITMFIFKAIVFTQTHSYVSEKYKD